jgi:hypothetical protein
LFESTSLEPTAESESPAASSAEYDDDDSHPLIDTDSKIDFRVLRRIGEDALLVSWRMPERQETVSSGYEVMSCPETCLTLILPQHAINLLMHEVEDGKYNAFFSLPPTTVYFTLSPFRSRDALGKLENFAVLFTNNTNISQQK